MGKFLVYSCLQKKKNVGKYLFEQKNCIYFDANWMLALHLIYLVLTSVTGRDSFPIILNSIFFTTTYLKWNMRGGINASDRFLIHSFFRCKLHMRITLKLNLLIWAQGRFSSPATCCPAPFPGLHLSLGVSVLAVLWLLHVCLSPSSLTTNEYIHFIALVEAIPGLDFRQGRTLYVSFIIGYTSHLNYNSSTIYPDGCFVLGHLHF